MRRLLLWLVVAAALVAVLLLADAALAGSVQSRLEEDISESMGQPATVELHGRPLVLRALTFGLPRVDITASPAEGAALASLEATLSGVRVPLGGLVRRQQRWTARGLDARVDPNAPFFGSERLLVEGAGLDGRSEGSTSLVDVELLEATAAPDGPSLQAEAEEIRLRLPDDAPPEAAVGRAQLAAADPSGALPLGVDDLLLDATDAAVTRSEGGTRLAAATLDVEGSGVPLGDSGAVMDRLQASLPDAVVVRPAGTGERPPVVITSRDASFSATIEEAVIDELWRFPGTVAFADQRIELTVGAVTLEAEASVQDGAIALQPVVPALARPFVGELPSLLLEPPVPEGATLETLVLRPGELEVSGGGERIVVR